MKYKDAKPEDTPGKYLPKKDFVFITHSHKSFSFNVKIELKAMSEEREKLRKNSMALFFFDL